MLKIQVTSQVISSPNQSLDQVEGEIFHLVAENRTLRKSLSEVCSLGPNSISPSVATDHLPDASGGVCPQVSEKNVTCYNGTKTIQVMQGRERKQDTHFGLFFGKKLPIDIYLSLCCLWTKKQMESLILFSARIVPDASCLKTGPTGPHWGQCVGHQRLSFSCFWVSDASKCGWCLCRPKRKKNKE